MVFIWALELKVLPPNPPQHSCQFLLQLQFPAESKKAGGEIDKVTAAQTTGELDWFGVDAKAMR